MAGSLIFPNINEIIGSTERSTSFFIMFRLVLRMHNIELEGGEQLSRLISKIEKTKDLSRDELFSTVEKIDKLLLKKSNILTSIFHLVSTRMFTISDFRYKGNWLDFRSFILGTQLTNIKELSPWTNYILRLCEKEKKMLMASRKGRDLTSFSNALSEELLFDKWLCLEFTSLLRSLPKSKVELLKWEDCNKTQLIRLESYLLIARLMNFLAICEAVMCIGRPSYILSNTIFSSFIPKIENNKIRLPSYFFVAYLKKHIGSSEEIKELISPPEKKSPLSSYEKLAQSINHQLGDSGADAEAIQRMLSRWQRGDTPIKPEKIKEYVNCYTYHDKKNNNLFFSVIPYIVNYLTKNISDLRKNHSDIWIVEQFERYPLYREKVFNQINNF